MLKSQAAFILFLKLRIASLEWLKGPILQLYTFQQMQQKVKLVCCNRWLCWMGRQYHLWNVLLVIQPKNGMPCYIGMGLRKILRWDFETIFVLTGRTYMDAFENVLSFQRLEWIPGLVLSLSVPSILMTSGVARFQGWPLGEIIVGCVAHLGCQDVRFVSPSHWEMACFLDHISPKRSKVPGIHIRCYKQLRVFYLLGYCAKYDLLSF